MLARYIASVLIIELICLPPSLARAETVTYEVKTGDTLSEIVRDHVPGRVWGRGGTLVTVLSHNPDIRSPDLIFPGDLIFLAFDDSSPSRAGDRGPVTATPPQPERSTSSPAVSPDPARALAGEDEKESLPSHLSLGLGFGYSVIRGVEVANRSSAELTSGLNSGARAAWIQNWSENLSSSFFGHVRKESYYPSSSAVGIGGADQTLSRFGFGVKRALGPRLELRGSFSVGQELWYRATSSTHLQIEKVTVPAAKAGGVIHVARIRQYRIDLSAEGTHLLGSSSGIYRLSSGKGYELGLGLAEIRKSGSVLRCGGRYSTYWQNATILKVRRSDLSLDCGWEWEW